MSVRVGLAGVSHVHAGSYRACLGDAYIGFWDEDGGDFGRGETVFASLDALLDACDAVVIAGNNVSHRAIALAAFAQGKHVLCEKPLAPTIADAEAMIAAAKQADRVLMTAFPCPYSPAFERALARVQRGEIGTLKAVCATNRGTCPGGWFMDPAQSGGGALLDHSVHVADLLRRLLGEEPTSVAATVGNNLRQGAVEDTAMITMNYPSGVFATLDASWSRTSSYRTWGDVTLNIVGTEGVIEVDLFGPGIDVYSDTKPSHRMDSYGANLDDLMVKDFLRCIAEGGAPRCTGEDGLAATRVAEMAYANLTSAMATAR
ncbi:MAG: Gfo/Idh/MocA family oxidoreductase [Chthonomonas sp.]|nr:Gfo/Idh/MocA family oxidoreductase [Chthonomonas sp.]